MDIENKYIKGSNTIHYTVLEPKNVMQIDLQPPLKISKVQQAGVLLAYTQEGNAYFIRLKEEQVKGSSKEIEVTKQDKGKFVGELYSGGFEFKLPDGSVVRSSNLTPHKSTGLGNWTNEQFINRFKIYGDSSYVNHKVTSGEFQTTMPWTMYSGMNEAVLEAIFIYLQSLSPVINQVEKFTPIKVN